MTREEILEKHCGYHYEQESFKNMVLPAMDEYMKQCCLELLEYMAKNQVDCGTYKNKDASFYFKGEMLTKEQLFENFL